MHAAIFSTSIFNFKNVEKEGHYQSFIE